MAGDAETARRKTAAKAPARPPVPRSAGDGSAYPSAPPPASAHDPMSYTYTTDLAAIRAVVHRYAITAGLSEARAIDLVLAVSEVAANTVRHAKSPGSLQIWYDTIRLRAAAVLPWRPGAGTGSGLSTRFATRSRSHRMKPGRRSGCTWTCTPKAPL
jgi:hypothetical protein